MLLNQNWTATSTAERLMPTLSDLTAALVPLATAIDAQVSDANNAVTSANQRADGLQRQLDVTQTALQKVQGDLSVSQLALQNAQAQAKPPAITVGPTYIPAGDIGQIAPLVRKDGLQILMTPGAAYTAASPNTIEILGRGVSIIGQNNTLNITGGKTALAAEAVDCSICGFTGITGNALFLRVGMTSGAPRFVLRGCYATGWALVTVGSNSAGVRIIDCGGKTTKATAYIAGDDCQVVNFAGDGSYDEHPLRIDGDGGPNPPARVSILGGHFVTLANKEAIAIRNARDFRLFDAALHGPLLLAQGAGAAPPTPYVAGIIGGITSDWNGGAPGAQLDLRTGSQIVLLPSKFSITNPKQDRVMFGPGSTLTLAGANQMQLAKGLTGGLFQGWGGMLAGVDATIVNVVGN